MSASRQAQAIADAKDGGVWTTSAALGVRINEDGTTTEVFGIEVSVRKAGGKRPSKRFTCWQATESQPADEMLRALRQMFGCLEAWS